MSEDIKGAKNRKVANLVVEFYMIVVGVAVGYATEQLLNVFTFAAFARFLAVLTMMIIWLHGQLEFTSSYYSKDHENWILQFLDYLTELANPVILTFVALLLQKEIAFYFLVAGSYAIDLLGEILYIFRLGKERQGQTAWEYQLIRNWIIVDSFVILTVGLLIGFRVMSGLHELMTSLTVLLIVLIATIWDFRKNQDFYFG